MNRDPAVLRLARIRKANGLKDEPSVPLTFERSDQRDPIARHRLGIELAIGVEMAERQREADVLRFQLHRRRPRHG
jgi:hypothetical protein